MFEQFLDNGIAIAGVDVGESYGSPNGRAIYSALYDELVENRGLAKKACLLARSRGGLMLYCWAVEHPESVACIAGIYPVCNISSYPGLRRACGAYGMTERQLAAKLYEHNPIDRLAPLAKEKVPIFHIHGDRDAVVPLDKNSGEVLARYSKLGGKMTLEVVKGQGHNLWSGWFHSQDLVDFVIAHARNENTIPPEKLNVILITADDLNYDSVGAYGCEVPGITPHIDRLAREGLLLRHAHVNIAVCQPSRQSIMTGRYPHRNGAKGFDPIDEDVPTLQERLRVAGYLNGILGKEIHLKPKHKYCWDYYITESQLASGAGIGRSPHRYHEHTKAFISMAKERGKPFFLMANIHDPHRPFAGSEQERRSWGHDLPKVTRRIGEDEITVPKFLADLPDTRKEVAQYYTSVFRCDQSVGAVLEALKESGREEDTLVMFLSDNGMAVPFAKANCYLNSTKTPWIVRWPGQVKPGSVDAEHLISGIDYMPTILEALGIEAPDGMDGSSFLPVLRGEQQTGRRHVFTEFHKTFARRCYPMRCVQGERFGYLINFWAGRTAPMRMDSTSGLSFKAMQEAGKTDRQVAARVALFEHRVLEEFYDFKNDPDGLHNLIDDPRYQDEIARMRSLLEERMKRTKDPALQAFLGRHDATILDAFMNQLKGQQ